MNAHFFKHLKRLVSIWIFLVVGLVGYGQFNNPIVNGVITANEYGNHTLGQNQGYNSSSTTYWYCTWNGDSIFFAASGGFDPSTSGTSNGDAVCIYLDIDPQVPVNAGNGMIQGTSYDGVTPNLPFSADAFLFVKAGQQDRLLHSSGNWTNTSSTVIHPIINYTNKIIELKIAWTDLGLSGRPPSFNWTGFISFDNRNKSSNNGSIAHVPELNPGGTAPDLIRYFTIDTTSSGTTVQPFERESYTHIGNDISNFGPIDVWDFTMNTSGKYISRAAGSSGDWNINNDLLVGNGTIYFYTSSSQTNIDGDVITLSGGTVDIDNSTGVTNIARNINNEGTLKGSSYLSSTVNLKGDFNNQGTFTSNSTLFRFNRVNTAQNISGSISGVNCFNRLEIDNKDGLVNHANDTLVINDSLLLSNGILKKYNNSLVKLRDTAKCKPISGSDSSYIEGWLIREMFDTDTAIFPIGDNEWAPIGVEPENSKNGRAYQARYFKTGPGTSNDLKTQTPQLLYVSYVEYWDLKPLGTSTLADSSAKVSLYWRNYSEVSSDPNERDSLKVCHYDSAISKWGWIDPQMNNINDYGVDSGVVKTITYTSDFSPFTLGTTISDNPLPVNLTSFDAHLSKNQQAIDLNWTTASELNCARFVLQKKNEDHWQTISEQRCNAVSNELLHYNFTDFDVQSSNQYRLLQIDLDGKEAIYGPVMVDVSQTKFKIVPNPANSYFTVSNSHKIRTITIIDAFGKIVDTSQADHRFNTQSLRDGVYNILIVDKSGVTHTQRLVVMH